MFSVPSPRRTFGRIREQITENPRRIHLLENSHKLCRGVQQAMEARTCFISFIKLLFSLLTKRKTVYEARTVNSYNSETWHFGVSQSYENTLVDQSKRTYYPNYFIICNNNI